MASAGIEVSTPASSDEGEVPPQARTNTVATERARYISGVYDQIPLRDD